MRFAFPWYSARLVKPLAAALVLSIAVLVAACDDSDSASGDNYIERALKERENANLRASLIELRNAVRAEPDNARARALLGETYIDLGDPVTAEKELLRARDLGSPPSDWILPLARAWVAAGQFDRILEEVQVDSESPKDLQSKALYARGSALLGKNDIPGAENAFKEALAADPSNVLAVIGLGRIEAQSGNMEAASARLAEAIAMSAEDRNVLAFAGDLYMSEARYEEAEANYRKLSEQYPENPVVKLSLAHSLLALGKTDEAIPMLDAVSNILPNSVRASYLRALAAYQVKDYEVAKDRADRVLTAVPNHAQSLLISGASNFALEKYEQAASRLDVFLTASPNNIPARRMLGLTYMRIGNAARAYEVLQPIGDVQADDVQLQAMIGAAAVRSGDLASGAKYLERASALNPDSAELRARLGAVRVSMGDLKRGVEDLEHAIDQDPTLDRALVSLALTQLREKRFDEVIEAADRLRESNPDSSIGWTLKGIALAAQGNLAESKNTFRELLEKMPGAPDALINLAAMEMREGNEEEALKILSDGLIASDNNTRVMLRLAQVESRLGRLPEAEQHLRSVVAQKKEDLVAKGLLAETLARQNKLDEALEIARQITEVDGKNAPAHEIIGRISLVQGNTEKSIEAFEVLAEARPDRAEAHFLLAQAYASVGDAEHVDKFVAALEKSVSVDPTYIPARIQLAAALTQRGEIERAKEMLASLQTEAPNNVLVKELSAGIALREHRLDDAVTALEEAIEIRPSTGLILRLSEARRLAGDPAAARSTLEEWLGRNPEDAAVRFMLANVDLSEGRQQQALDNYLMVLSAAPNNVVARNNVAWLFQEQGRPQAAREHIERALELAPEDPRIMDTAGVVYLQLGESDRALHLLSNAARLQPDNSDIQLHLAQVHVKQGNKEEARAILRNVLAKQEPFSGRDEAQRLLDGLAQ